RVRVRYPSGINPQAAFYAAAARHSLPKLFAAADTIKLTILQPAAPSTERASSTVVTPAELDAFVVAYRAACAEALAPAPRLQRGAHCRFCPARPICPAHTAPSMSGAHWQKDDLSTMKRRTRHG